jgi:transcriptional regulator with XRE-family HTH domain
MMAGVKLAPHEWVKETRLDRGIRQEDVETLTAKIGPRSKISQSHLSKIERGNAPLSGLGPERMDALRQVIGVSTEEWFTHTGLSLITAETPDSSVPARRLRPIPHGLQEMINERMSLAPELGDERWQQYLAGQRFATGSATPERWWNLFLVLRAAGVEPGGN